MSRIYLFGGFGSKQNGATRTRLSVKQAPDEEVTGEKGNGFIMFKGSVYIYEDKKQVSVFISSKDDGKDDVIFIIWGGSFGTDKIINKNMDLVIHATSVGGYGNSCSNLLVFKGSNKGNNYVILYHDTYKSRRTGSYIKYSENGVEDVSNEINYLKAKQI